MRHPLIALALAVSIASAWPAATPSANPATSAARAKTRGEPYEGEWRVEPKQPGRYEIAFQRSWKDGSSTGSWHSTFDIRPGDLTGISATQWSDAETPVSFVLKRDAGSMRGVGRLRQGRGSGQFVFEPNPAFEAELERSGFKDPSMDDLVRLSMHDVSRAWLRSFGSRGTRTYSLDELLRFKIYDISGEYVLAMKEAGVSDAGVDELVRLKIQSVEPSYVRELTAGSRRRYTSDEIVLLKVNGVTPAMIRRAKARNHGVTVDEIIRLKYEGMI